MSKKEALIFAVVSLFVGLGMIVAGSYTYFNPAVMPQWMPDEARQNSISFALLGLVFVIQAVWLYVISRKK